MEDKKPAIPKKVEAISDTRATAINALIDLVTDLQARLETLEASKAPAPATED